MEKNVTVLKAIRNKCLECCGYSPNEVKNCTSKTCPLYVFRFGKNPFRQKREMTDEQREQASERLKKARENRKLASN